MGAKQKAEAKRELAAKRRQLTQPERRIEELDRLFKRIYEDTVGGKLSNTPRIFAESPAKRRNGIAEAVPFPENNLMLFYARRPKPCLFYNSKK